MTNQNNNQKITVSQETEFNAPATLPFHWVDKFDWERLKSIVKRIETKSGKWENFAWFMVATSIGFFIAALQENNNLFWTAFTFSVILTIIAFFSSKLLAKKDREAKNDALNEMETIEVKSRMISSPDTISQELNIIKAMYGKDFTWLDVTEEIKKSVTNNTLNVKVSNDIKHDPYVGFVKELKVEYKLNGKEKSKVVKEGEILTLP
jgi:hypothetical protein